MDGLCLFSLWTEILSYRDRILFITWGFALGLLADIGTCLPMPCLAGLLITFSSSSRHEPCALACHAGLSFVWPVHVLLPEHCRPQRAKGLWEEGSLHVSHRAQHSRNRVTKSRNQRRVRECCTVPIYYPVCIFAGSSLVLFCIIKPKEEIQTSWKECTFLFWHGTEQE